MCDETDIYSTDCFISFFFFDTIYLKLISNF